MNLFELFVKIDADTSKAEKGMKSTQGVSETLTNKIKVMSAQFEAAQKNVDKLTQEFNESVNKAGATDKATLELAKKLAEAEKEAGKFAKELNEVQKEAEQADSALDDCNEEIEDTGEKAEKSGNSLANFAGKLGKGLATAAKIGTAAVGAAAAGITALTKAAVDNYAEYEQLIGGVETLFKTSADKVVGYAENAYKTAGLSANEYMETVTSFSASLLQSLDEDTEAATEYANQAITDMADNANKMGTSMEMIQNAYQGFAKQNYSMLDNLKLGYGGTAQEMHRLLQRAAELDETFAKTAKFSIDSKGHLEAEFADITQAIHIVQTEMDITGTTALEAGRTISGSVGAMKSAWTNLVTGFADGNADIEGLIDNLVTTIVGDGTENNLGLIGNVLPAVERALNGIGKLIEGAVPVLIERLPGLLQQILPVLLSSATSLVNSVIEVLPELVDLIVDTLIDNAPMLIVAAVELILALAGGLIQAVPKLLKAIPTIIKETVNGFKNSENIKKFIDVGKNIIDGIKKGISNAWSSLKTSISNIWTNIKNVFSTAFSSFSSIGSNIVSGIKTGISNAWTNLKKWFKRLFGDLIGIAKKILGIASPSKVFKKIGGFTAEGFGVGFEDEFAHVKDDMKKALTFEEASIGINASIKRTGAGQGAFGSNAGGVSIVQNIYSEAKTAADLMQEALYHQERAVLLGV